MYIYIHIYLKIHTYIYIDIHISFLYVLYSYKGYYCFNGGWFHWKIWKHEPLGRQAAGPALLGVPMEVVELQSSSLKIFITIVPCPIIGWVWDGSFRGCSNDFWMIYWGIDARRPNSAALLEYVLGLVQCGHLLLTFVLNLSPYWYPIFGTHAARLPVSRFTTPNSSQNTQPDKHNRWVYLSSCWLMEGPNCARSSLRCCPNRLSYFQ